MKKRFVNGCGAIPTHDQSAEVAEPSDGALDGPATAVPAQRATVLRRWPDPIPLVRGNQFDPATAETFPKRVTVIRLVGDYPPGFLAWSARPRAVPNLDGGERFLRQFDFRRGRRVQVVSQRKTLAVDHHHPLRPLAPLGFADFIAPFLAGAKLPSKNDSLHFNCWRSLSSPKNVRQIFNQMSCSSQSRSLRQQVDGWGYSLGKYFQGAPLRRIHRMPSNTRRFPVHGRPPRGCLGEGGSRGSIFFHCASLNNGPDRGIAAPFNHVIRDCNWKSQAKSET
jgi:hypothetical protein